LGLWTRLQGFRAEALTDLFARREVVRGTYLRATLHVTTARQFVQLRPILGAALDRGMRSILKKALDAFDLDEVVSAARALLDERPRTMEELRDVFAEAGASEVRARAYAVRCALPVLQVPDESQWGFPGSADFAPAESWLKTPIAANATDAR